MNRLVIETPLLMPKGARITLSRDYLSAPGVVVEAETGRMSQRELRTLTAVLSAFISQTLASGTKDAGLLFRVKEARELNELILNLIETE